MVICRYYQSGTCRYGNNCRYEHIDPPPGQTQGNNHKKDPFSTPNKRDKHRNDKSNDQQPTWPLSVIGFKDNTQQGNELSGDWSPEELRAAAYSMAPRGLSNEVTQREAHLLSEHKAKLVSLNLTDHRQTTPGGAAPPKDPFAQNGGGGAPQSFGQPFQQASLGQQNQTGNPFGQAPAPSQPFGASMQPSQPFSQPQQGFSNPQQPAPALLPAPLSSTAQEQFSAAQFGFAKVPESAPPPQFY